MRACDQVPEWELSSYHLLHRRILGVQQQSSSESYGHGLKKKTSTSIFVKKPQMSDGAFILM